MTHDRDTPTAFARWLKELGKTHQEAADLLGISIQRVFEYRRGASYAAKIRGKAVPDLVTRYAMAAVLAGFEPSAAVTARCPDPAEEERRTLLAITAAERGLEPYSAE